jgi:hypothetical protein
MRKPPYRTLFLLIAFALLGGGVAFAQLDPETYRAFLDLLKVLAGAQGLKSIGEHVAAALDRKPPPEPAK